MGSPVPLTTGSDRQRLGSDDVSSIRLTPTPGENYRCPVSTPSNYVQRHSRVRRTKPLDDIYSQPTTDRRSHRSRGNIFSLSRSNRSHGTTSRWTPKTGRSFDYYFVDKQGDKREGEQTNTVWLKALCSQPVNEILNKYRRKSDVKRTRVIWSKTFSTPGEKSLLNAWENNVFKGRGVKSAMAGGGRRTQNSSRTVRQTQSEPPFSTTGRHDDMESVRSIYSPDRTRVDMTLTSDDIQAEKHCVYAFHVDNPVPEDDIPPIPAGTTPRKAMRDFLEQPSTESPRVTTYTAQVFKRIGRFGDEMTYTKVIPGPEHLPRLSGRHKVHSLLNNTHYHYAPPLSRQNSPVMLKQLMTAEGVQGRPGSAHRSTSTPIHEEDENEVSAENGSPTMDVA